MSILKEKGLLGYNMDDKKYAQLLDLAEQEYKKMGIKSHNWEHILRVVKYCDKLSTTNQSNKDILFPAAILHDLGREKNAENNHSESTSTAKQILEKSGYDTLLINQIIDCIKSHSIDSTEEPSSLEAKILFDADKLDSLGTIGIARFFILAGEQGWNLDEATNEALRRITKLKKMNGFYTTQAKKLGAPKAKTAIKFYDQLFKELEKK